jgi:hypothetical protein
MYNNNDRLYELKDLDDIKNKSNYYGDMYMTCHYNNKKYNENNSCLKYYQYKINYELLYINKKIDFYNKYKL